MNTEYEIRVLEVDVDKVVRKLDELGAEKIGEYDLKRCTYDFTPVKENSWIRLRTNGKKTTIAIKEIHDYTVDGTKELETEVGNFETMYEILEKLGYNHKNYQENKRTSYKLDGVMVEIDS
ncbi:MAG TPA: hypothetical protein DCP90_02405 [Clostridiales bacterium]|nr:hypothetical protein [Clostridiales bacterium]